MPRVKNASKPATRTLSKSLKPKTSIIFIHGLRGNHLGLEEIAANFSKKSYDIHIIDIPPAGGDTLPEYSARFYARFVAKYIRKNQLEKPVLVGHSMGSIIAAAVAERYPELIAEKIIFMSPISVKPAKFFALLTPLIAVLPNKQVDYITTKYMFTPREDRALFRKVLQVTHLCSMNYRPRSAAFKSACFSVSCAISDFEFKKTALFLSGTHDRLIPQAETELTAKKFGAKTIYIENSGHLLNYERPKEAAKAIKNFLRHA